MPQQVELHQLVHRVYFIVNPSKQKKKQNPQNKTKTNNNNEKQKAKQTPKKQQQKDKNKKRQNLDMGNLFQTTDHLQCVTTKCIISKMCCIYKTLQLNVLHVRFVTLTVCYIFKCFLCFPLLCLHPSAFPKKVHCLWVEEWVSIIKGARLLKTCLSNIMACDVFPWVSRAHTSTADLKEAVMWQASKDSWQVL